MADKKPAASGSQNQQEDPAKVAEEVVSNLKSQGLFDQFRKECLEELENMESYRLLKQRVENHVASFLSKFQWSEKMSKNNVRDSLRTNINRSEVLLNGIDRLIDQILTGKTESFSNRIGIEVDKHLGIERKEVLQAPGTAGDSSQQDASVSYMPITGPPQSSIAHGIKPVVDSISSQPTSNCNHPAKESNINNIKLPSDASNTAPVTDRYREIPNCNNLTPASHNTSSKSCPSNLLPPNKHEDATLQRVNTDAVAPSQSASNQSLTINSDTQGSLENFDEKLPDSSANHSVAIDKTDIANKENGDISTSYHATYGTNISEICTSDGSSKSDKIDSVYQNKEEIINTNVNQSPTDPQGSANMAAKETHSNQEILFDKTEIVEKNTDGSPTNDPTLCISSTNTVCFENIHYSDSSEFKEKHTLDSSTNCPFTNSDEVVEVFTTSAVMDDSLHIDHCDEASEHDKALGHYELKLLNSNKIITDYESNVVGSHGIRTEGMEEKLTLSTDSDKDNDMKLSIDDSEDKRSELNEGELVTYQSASEEQYEMVDSPTYDLVQLKSDLDQGQPNIDHDSKQSMNNPNDQQPLKQDPEQVQSTIDPSEKDHDHLRSALSRDQVESEFDHDQQNSKLHHNQVQSNLDHDHIQSKTDHDQVKSKVDYDKIQSLNDELQSKCDQKQSEPDSNQVESRFGKGQSGMNCDKVILKSAHDQVQSHLDQSKAPASNVVGPGKSEIKDELQVARELSCVKDRLEKQSAKTNEGSKARTSGIRNENPMIDELGTKTIIDSKKGETLDGIVDPVVENLHMAAGEIALESPQEYDKTDCLGTSDDNSKIPSNNNRPHEVNNVQDNKQDVGQLENEMEDNSCERYKSSSDSKDTGHDGHGRNLEGEMIEDHIQGPGKTSSDPVDRDEVPEKSDAEPKPCCDSATFVEKTDQTLAGSGSESVTDFDAASSDSSLGVNSRMIKRRKRFISSTDDEPTKSKSVKVTLPRDEINEGKEGKRETQFSDGMKVKRGRGRPKKTEKTPEDMNKVENELSTVSGAGNVRIDPNRGRQSRTKKQPVQELSKGGLKRERSIEEESSASDSMTDGEARRTRRQIKPKRCYSPSDNR